ncbi:uncharacterized protein METZ01_LOCUS48549 [marine metagenome]|uniref:Uncharacterized protein n=1 Tax=marine metagenome TaxID=408172 RepID=A0A381RUY6_9ZZZZ
MRQVIKEVTIILRVRSNMSLAPSIPIAPIVKKQLKLYFIYKKRKGF